jgi:hypothetical protein
MERGRISFEDAHGGCRKMWEELARTGGVSKKTALTEIGYDPQYVKFECFACEYTDSTDEYGYYWQDCQLCPVHWGDIPIDDEDGNPLEITSIFCENMKDSPYKKWRDLRANASIQAREERKRLAKIISELLWTDKIDKWKEEK